MMRTVGVEEELLLVDADVGRPRSVAGRVLQAVEAEPRPYVEAGPGGSLDNELQQQQLETDTPPRAEMSVLDADIREWRNKAIAAARREGARVLATGTSPMPVEPHLVHHERFEQMVEHFGITTSEQLTCGCHVHVSVESEDEGVGVLDRIRVWLPSLLAISANSPFWQGVDTRYASFRSQAMIRWPTAGPSDAFGSAENYRKLMTDMIASGVLLDEGMAYFDARLSHRYPTVEIRAADVCLDAGDAVVIAALCRGLVETAAGQWEAGQPTPPVATSMLRLATWQAGRHGLSGNLLDPLTCRPRPAHDVVDQLVDHVRSALRDSGDETLVERGLDRVLARGNGAARQRSVLERTGQMSDVIADLARVTAGQESA